jgi:hypothetical protein
VCSNCHSLATDGAVTASDPEGANASFVLETKGGMMPNAQR